MTIRLKSLTLTAEQK
uniref:Uncharacterized protein n=3 Tax=Percomorphaceae TaxID=1489872 RepID=A0A3Q3ECJ8_9LABR